MSHISPPSSDSGSDSGSETDSECVSPRTVIPSPKSKEVKSPENVDNTVVSSERSENPAENVSAEEKLEGERDTAKDQEEDSLSSDEIPSSDEVTKEEDDDQSSKVLAHLKPSRSSSDSGSETGISPSSSDSGSETDSECVSPRTVIPSPKSKEVKSPENVDNTVVSSERSENPAENVSAEEKLEGERDTAKDQEEDSLSSDEIPSSDEVTKEEDDDDQSSKVLAHLKPSPSVHVMESHHHQQTTTNSEISIVNPLMVEAWDNLKKSVVMFNGIPVGTLAALDHSVEALNYNQVFVRDFVPSGLAYMMQSKPEVQIVKNFLLKTLHLQSWEKKVDNFTLAEGVMPASFKVLPDSPPGRDTLKADFGGSAIGRVAPVDSGFWWIIMLSLYTKCSQDFTLAEMPEVQRGIRLILNLCLSDGFDTFPTFLCADACSMIDRRMGVYGYPIEIQALFYFALRCAHQLLKPECGGKELLERIDKRIIALRYRYKTEEYSDTAVNKFNVLPYSIPKWVFDFMPPFEEDQMKTRQPVTMEDLNLDVVTNVLRCLVYQLGREDVLPNLLNISLADRNLDTVVKSLGFMKFIHHHVWKQKLWITSWESGWESMLHAHRSYRNFLRGLGRRSISDISLDFCSAIGIYGERIICGYQCGLIVIYQIIEGRLSQPDVRPVYQMGGTKDNDYSWAVVGFMTDPNPDPKEIFMATFDGCIYGIDMCTMCFSLMHFGRYSQDGGLVHFDGSDFGWVGIYVGKPHHSFRVWNRNREVIYSGGSFMMADARSIYGLRLGRLIVVDKVVFACSRRGIISFTLTDPSITREIMNQEGGVLVASFSGNSSCIEVVSGAHLYIFSISDLAFVRKERISAYTTAVNEFFKIWVYGSGSVFMLHNETGGRRRIEPRVGRVSALKLDQKCLILANASTINMWFYGRFF